MAVIPNYPHELSDLHHAWHSPGAHDGVPTRVHLPGSVGAGLEFLTFHRDFVHRFHQWYDGQPFADPGAVTAWTDVPAEVRAQPGWSTWVGDVDRIVNHPESFASADELGAFIEGGVHNQFLHGAAAAAYNEPVLSSFHSPLSTYFYQLHGLVQRWWEAWEARRPRPAVTGNPVLLQGRFGKPGNFELVTPLGGGGLAHFWRNNDPVEDFHWEGPIPFGAGLGHVDSVTMIQSNYGDPGNLEVIARVGETLQFFWRDSGPSFAWNGPFQLASGAAGNPVLLQSRFGERGNFELVYPAAGGGVAFLWRNNDDPAMPWSAPSVFGTELGHVEALTMIQSNYGDPGNLELIARVGDTLQFFWRDSGPTFTWNGPYQLASGAAGNPVLLQSRFGERGNFELVYPAAGGGVAFLWRNNDDPAMPWSAPFVFATGLGSVDAVTLIQSDYGDPGNLELVARVGGSLQFFWRDSGPTFTWNGPYLVP